MADWLQCSIRRLEDTEVLVATRALKAPDRHPGKQPAVHGVHGPVEIVDLPIKNGGFTYKKWWISL